VDEVSVEKLYVRCGRGSGGGRGRERERKKRGRERSVEIVMLNCAMHYNNMCTLGENEIGRKIF